MKLGELKARIVGLQAVQMKKFPVRVSYAIAKNLKVLLKEHEDFEYSRIEICKDYAEKDEKGDPLVEDGSYVILDEKKQEFNEEIDSLARIDAELNIIKVDLSEFDKCEDEKYDLPNAYDFEALDFMID